jgi:hypothetical protein
MALLTFGSAGRARTADPVVNSHLLYQLSYCGPGPKIIPSGGSCQHLTHDLAQFFTTADPRHQLRRASSRTKEVRLLEFP